VQFGVASPGGSDLIGYRQVVIGPEHVGRTMAVFTAVEVKSAVGRATAEQRAFIQHVKQAGGIAGVVRSVDEARVLLGLD
jgi:AmiR/NasT family two-component response regulator